MKGYCLQGLLHWLVYDSLLVQDPLCLQRKEGRARQTWSTMCKMNTSLITNLSQALLVETQASLLILLAVSVSISTTSQTSQCVEQQTYLLSWCL